MNTDHRELNNYTNIAKSTSTYFHPRNNYLDSLQSTPSETLLTLCWHSLFINEVKLTIKSKHKASYALSGIC